MATAPATHVSDTTQALLTAIGSVVCLLAAEVLGIQRADLAVWTSYMVMVQFTYTSFQKGLERIIGRGVGILAGLVLTTWFNDTPVLTAVLIVVSLTGLFYLNFAGRLAYTFLNAGLYLVAIFQIGHANPAGLVPTAVSFFAAVVLGVAVADVVTWLAGSEGSLHIELGTTPLLPIRREWLNQALMLAVTVLLTLVGTNALGLPPDKAAISVMVLTMAPHVQAMVVKGELRLAGAFLAAVWGAVSFVIVGSVPSLLLLAAFLFLGLFVAAYLARTGGTFAYAGVQMGLVLPMLLVVPRNEFGSLLPVVQRLEGIVVGIIASVLVAGVWPGVLLKAPPPPPPAMPPEMEV